MGYESWCGFRIVESLSGGMVEFVDMMELVELSNRRIVSCDFTTQGCTDCISEMCSRGT